MCPLVQCSEDSQLRFLWQADFPQAFLNTSVQTTATVLQIELLSSVTRIRRLQVEVRSLLFSFPIPSPYFDGSANFSTSSRNLILCQMQTLRIAWTSTMDRGHCRACIYWKWSWSREASSAFVIQFSFALVTCAVIHSIESFILRTIHDLRSSQGEMPSLQRIIW